MKNKTIRVEEQSEIIVKVDKKRSGVAEVLVYGAKAIITLAAIGAVLGECIVRK